MYTVRNVKQNVLLLSTPAARSHTTLWKNNVNNFQRIPMNFSEITIVRGLAPRLAPFLSEA